VIEDALVKVCIMRLFMSKFCYIEMPAIGEKYGLLLYKIHVTFYYIYINIYMFIHIEIMVTRTWELVYNDRLVATSKSSIIKGELRNHVSTSWFMYYASWLSNN